MHILINTRELYTNIDISDFANGVSIITRRSNSSTELPILTIKPSMLEQYETVFLLASTNLNSDFSLTRNIELITLLKNANDEGTYIKYAFICAPDASNTLTFYDLSMLSRVIKETLEKYKQLARPSFINKDKLNDRLSELPDYITEKELQQIQKDLLQSFPGNDLIYKNVQKTCAILDQQLATILSTIKCVDIPYLEERNK